jgi:hypothetical protein
MDGHHGREKRERRERGEARVTSGIQGLWWVARISNKHCKVGWQKKKKKLPDDY